jgi:TolB-like protein
MNRLFISFLLLLTISFSQENKPIAILEFENISNIEQYNWLSGGIPEILTSKLSNVPELVVIERRQIKKALKEIAFSQMGFVDSDKATNVGEMLGAKNIIIGSFQIVDELILITARIVDVESSQISSAKTVQGNIDKIFGLEYQLAEQLIKEIGFELSENIKEKIRLAGTDYLKSQALIAEAERLEIPDYTSFNWDLIQRQLNLIDEALVHNPTNYQALRWGGIIFSYAKYYDQAVYMLESALEQTPDDQLIRNSLVHPYLATGDYDKAIKYQKELYQEGYYIYENDPVFIIDGYFRKGDLDSCSMWINQLSGSSEYLDAILERWKWRVNNVEKGVSSIKAYILERKADSFEFTSQDSVDFYLDRAIDISPKDGNLYFVKALAYGSNNIRGIPYYEKAIECGNMIQEDNATAYYNIGYIYGRRNDWEKARTNFKNAVMLSTYNKSRNLHNLAYTNFELGNIDRAYDQVKEVLRLDPEYELARVLYDQIEFQMSIKNDNQRQTTRTKSMIQAGLINILISFIGTALAILIFL